MLINILIVIYLLGVVHNAILFSFHYKDAKNSVRDYQMPKRAIPLAIINTLISWLYIIIGGLIYFWSDII